MVHTCPSKKPPYQPSFDMNPYYMNFSAGSQSPESASIQTAQSMDQDSCVFFSLQGLAFPTASQKSYSVLGHDDHGSSQPPQMPGMDPAPSFRQSLRSRFSKTPSPSLPSTHPYRQARLCHVADRASPQCQEWSQHYFPTVPAPNPTTPCNAVIGDCASTSSRDPRQLPLAATKIFSAPAFDSASQFYIAGPSTRQAVPSWTANPTVPRPTPPSTSESPASPPYILADEADIEYAQHRYGNKRCFYQCRFDLSGSPCNKWIVGDRVRVLRHLRQYHHLQTGPATPAFCSWDSCTHSRLMKQENLSRHVVMHLGVKWRCPRCRHLFSRDDAVHRHVERMHPGMDVPDAEVMPGWEARAVNEWQIRNARIA